MDYAKARPVFEQYKASKYSRKFLAEHEGEIALYRAATAQFATTRPEVIQGLGLAPTSRFSQKIATVATVALLAV